MFGFSQEEIFMTLTIALIIGIPVGVRIYRYFAVKRLKQQLKKKGESLHRSTHESHHD